jgi:hypothetical protein
VPDTTPSTEAGAVQRYRKKPVVIEALQWTGSNAEQMTAFAGPHFALVSPQDRAEDPERTAAVWDKLHSTWIGMHDGQWLIKGIRGEFYPHDESAFPEVYDLVTDEPDEPSLPEGTFGRIELPGYRNHTGWVTEETRFGVQMAVVRDWDGRVVAEVAPGPLCQFVYLPTPLRRPEPQERPAITRGAPPAWREAWDSAEDGAYDDGLDDEERGEMPS